MPREDDRRDAALTMPARASGPHHRTLHALVADDDLDRLADLTFRVARLGLTVSSAADRAEVWCAVHERPPDVVVLATSLALAQDADLMRRLARVGSATRTPFVLVARDEADATMARTPQPGVYAVPVHPCAWGDLETTLRRVTRDRPSGRVVVSRAGPIVVDGAVDAVTIAGTRVRVSSAELLLIRILLQAPEGVSDVEISGRLWNGRTARRSRALVSPASRLRRKLFPLGVQLERAPTLRGYLLRW